MAFPTTVPEALALGGRFVEEYWPGLAARAWNGLTTHGRGVVLVPWAAVEDWEQRRKVGVSGEMLFLRYATGPTWSVVGGGYDPEKEIVVAFCEEQVPSGSGPRPLTGRWTSKRFACGEAPPMFAARLPRLRPS